MSQLVHDPRQGRRLILDETIFARIDTSSRNFPTTPGAYDTSYNGGFDVFVAVEPFLPKITIISPTNSTYGPPGDVTLTYEIYACSATTVTVYLNSVANISACPSGYIYSLSTGSYNLTIVAEDAGGNIGNATIFFTIDTLTKKDSDDSPGLDLLPLLVVVLVLGLLRKRRKGGIQKS